MGTVGAGVAEVCARAGYETLVLVKSAKHAEQGLARVAESLSRAKQRSKITAEEEQNALRHISTTTDIERLAICDLVIESISESLALKQAMFQKLDQICNFDTILSSTTSSISIVRLAQVTRRPGQVVGTHFFNPVAIMQLVELATTKDTNQEVVFRTRQFLESLNKIPVFAGNSPGLLVNRMLFPYLLDAIRILESGYASKEQIDLSMELGCNLPMGPLKLVDTIGLDTVKSIADNLLEAYKEDRFKAPHLLVDMVRAGKLGRKSRKGFYDY